MKDQRWYLRTSKGQLYSTKGLVCEGKLPTQEEVESGRLSNFSRMEWLNKAADVAKKVLNKPPTLKLSKDDHADMFSFFYNKGINLNRFSHKTMGGNVTMRLFSGDHKTQFTIKFI